MPTRRDVDRYRENLQGEVDAAAQYRAMAAGEKDTQLADVYSKLAATEERHAAFWEKKLADAGAPPGRSRPSLRSRILIGLALRLGARSILATVSAGEYADRDAYAGQAETAGTGMVAQEHGHARVLQAIEMSEPKGLGGGALARLEGRHRNVGGNALRAAVLGANDGLCSNLSLVMGVAGASTSSHTLLITGMAGLLAGACSMALGEWVSVTSSRELAEREIRVEASELEQDPASEAEELQLIYEAKGLPKDEAREVAREMMGDPKKALDAMSREELGIDPTELGGSAWQAAITSFVLFSFGAIFPVLPFLALSGLHAVAASAALSAVVLFAVGAAIALFTGRGFLFSGARQLVLGLAAAALTYGIGHLLGVAIAG